MARVVMKTKNSGGKHVYTCSGCGEPVTAGTKYYTWARRFGRTGVRYYQHATCGYPRPTQLSSRKTAVVDEAITDANLAQHAPELPYEDAVAGGTLDVPYDDLQAALASVAEEARTVGEEYTSGADNMPDSLQYGQQAEAMRAVGDELESWADNLDNWDPSCTTTIDVPADYAGTDADKAALAALWEEAVQELVTEAQDHLDAEGVPEYQG